MVAGCSEPSCSNVIILPVQAQVVSLSCSAATGSSQWYNTNEKRKTLQGGTLTVIVIVSKWGKSSAPLANSYLYLKIKRGKWEKKRLRV